MSESGEEGKKRYEVEFGENATTGMLMGFFAELQREVFHEGGHTLFVADSLPLNAWACVRAMDTEEDADYILGRYVHHLKEKYGFDADGETTIAEALEAVALNSRWQEEGRVPRRPPPTGQSPPWTQPDRPREFDPEVDCDPPTLGGEEEDD